MNQNHTGIRSDSRTSGNKNPSLGMFGRAVSFSIMFILPLSFLAPGACMLHFRRTDYWITALLLTAVDFADDLIVEHGTIGRAWDDGKHKRT